MGKRIISSVALSTMLFASSATAEVENWYAYWGIGFSNTTYPSWLGNSLDAMESAPGVTRLEVAIDAFGFYWPLSNDKTLLGFVVNGTGDRLDDGATFLQVNQYLYSLSSMHFLGSEPGDGFFIRGDIGVSKAIISSSTSPDVSSDTGNGYLLGVGYGLRWPGNSLLFNLNYANRTIESEEYSTVGISVGILW